MIVGIYPSLLDRSKTWYVVAFFMTHFQIWTRCILLWKCPLKQTIVHAMLSIYLIQFLYSISWSTSHCSQFFFQACISFKIVSNDFRTASNKFKKVKMKTTNISIKDRLLENISWNGTTYDWSNWCNFVQN